MLKSLQLNPPASVVTAAKGHLLVHQISIWGRTDRMLAGLLGVEWIGGIALALWRSPYAWLGATSSVHPHVWAAIFLGLAIISLPIFLAVTQPAKTLTRHTIAAGQMLMSALLIHLGDGRIEMHFHIFGSLAFIAFYRDWRVLVTASVVTALDHLIRGFYLPASVYGVMSASVWRTVEHAWWVVFEDIFLITSCIQGVREMYGIALNRALLEHSYQDIEQKVTERTAELKNTQEELMKSARKAGMAEIATSVLHNVGNVLNSVNVSATVVGDTLRQSELPNLARVSNLMTEHKPDLGNYLMEDTRGRLIPGFITELAVCLNEEQTHMLTEVDNLARGIEHIKRIVVAQQSMAKSSQMCSKLNPSTLVETAISMQAVSNSSIEVETQLIDGPEVLLDQHKVLQILINLLSNARHAVMPQPAGSRRIRLSVEMLQTAKGDVLQYHVADSGVGIASENLTKIFSHGFTTKKEGHGFGLHSAANAAREMGGSLTAFSEGVGKGARFTLEIPAKVTSAI